MHGGVLQAPQLQPFAGRGFNLGGEAVEDSQDLTAALRSPEPAASQRSSQPAAA